MDACGLILMGVGASGITTVGKLAAVRFPISPDKKRREIWGTHSGYARSTSFFQVGGQQPVKEMLACFPADRQTPGAVGA
jgi:hypothetical protein